MNAEISDGVAAVEFRRAGFWRRWAAAIIDWIIVSLPFQILAVVLFSMTSGMVQMDSGFFKYCEVVKNIPMPLDPPPPQDFNVGQVCRISLFGATTGAILTVSRVTRQGATTTRVSQGYMLDSSGQPIHGTSIDGIAEAAFLAYLVLMIWKTGRTLGSRVLSIRVVDVSNPGASEVSLRKVILRYLAMTIGFLPALAVLIYQVETTAGSSDAVFTGDFFRWFAIAGLIAALWVLVLVIQVARKRDPIYDRLAGTAVLRVS